MDTLEIVHFLMSWTMVLVSFMFLILSFTGSVFLILVIFIEPIINFFKKK